jgi:hypothetical protein
MQTAPGSSRSLTAAPRHQEKATKTPTGALTQSPARPNRPVKTGSALDTHCGCSLASRGGLRQPRFDEADLRSGGAMRSKGDGEPAERRSVSGRLQFWLRFTPGYGDLLTFNNSPDLLRWTAVGASV